MRWPNVKVHGAATLLRSTPAEAYDELERTSHPRFACRERLVGGAADVHHAAAQPLVGLHEQAPPGPLGLGGAARVAVHLLEAVRVGTGRAPTGTPHGGHEDLVVRRPPAVAIAGGCEVDLDGRVRQFDLAV